MAIDHFKAGKLAAASFIRSGHTSFAYIGKSDDEKYLGFASVLYEHQLPVSDVRVFELEQTSNDNFLVRQGIERHFRQFETFPFTCVFTENDIVALECIKLIEERGLKVPEDISVIGFDDTYLSKIMGISSIHQPIEDMVSTSLELLINRIEEKLSPDIVSIQLEPTLMTRKSSNHRESETKRQPLRLPQLFEFFHPKNRPISRSRAGRRIRTVHDVAVHGEAEVAADRAGRGLGRVRAADDAPRHRDRIGTFPHAREYGAGGDEVDEFAEKFFVPVLPIVLLRELPRSG